MTKEDIIKLAREAGWDINDLIDVFDFGVRLERFANLVAAAKPWQGLTDEEANLLWENRNDKGSWELIKRVGAKLKEKNT